MNRWIVTQVFTVKKSDMVESKTKVTFVFLVVIPLLITFMASPLIIENEETKVIMYVNYNAQEKSGGKEVVDRRRSETSSLNCSWPPLKLLDPPGPVTALASKPGSGNTWVRHLIQLATGIQTGSIFREQRLKRNGFPGEGITNGSVVAIKTHNLHDGYAKFVIILRDPLHAALAEFNRRVSFRQDKEHSHTGHASLDQFEGEAWRTFVQQFFRSWREFSQQAASFGKERLCVLIYENLVQNVVEELKPCVEFLGFQMDAELAECIRKDQEGSFHRRPMSKEDLEMVFTKPFSPEELQNFQEMAQQVTQLLLKNSINHSF